MILNQSYRSPERPLFANTSLDRHPTSARKCVLVDDCLVERSLCVINVLAACLVVKMRERYLGDMSPPVLPAKLL